MLCFGLFVHFKNVFAILSSICICEIVANDWVLVFRAVTGDSQKSSEFDFIVIVGSTLVGDKLQLSVARVKIEFNDFDQTRVAYVIFNGTNSNRQDWFSRERIIESSFTDIQTAKSNIFSINGHASVNRRFHASSVYAGCPGDGGWFMVKDSRNRGSCSYEANYYVSILCCRRPKSCNFQTENKAGRLVVGSMSIYLSFSDEADVEQTIQNCNIPTTENEVTELPSTKTEQNLKKLPDLDLKTLKNEIKVDPKLTSSEVFY